MKSTQIYHISCFVCISVLCSFSRGPLISPLQTLSIKRETPFSPPLPLSHHLATAKEKCFSTRTPSPSPRALPLSSLPILYSQHIVARTPSPSLSTHTSLSTRASCPVWRRLVRLPLWRGGGHLCIDLERRRLAAHTSGKEKAGGE